MKKINLRFLKVITLLMIIFSFFIVTQTAQAQFGPFWGAPFAGGFANPFGGGFLGFAPTGFDPGLAFAGGGFGFMPTAFAPLSYMTPPSGTAAGIYQPQMATGLSPWGAAPSAMFPATSGFGFDPFLSGQFMTGGLGLGLPTMGMSPFGLSPFDPFMINPYNINPANGMMGQPGNMFTGDPRYAAMYQDPYGLNPYNQNPYNQNPYNQNPYFQNPYYQQIYNNNSGSSSSSGTYTSSSSPKVSGKWTGNYEITKGNPDYPENSSDITILAAQGTMLLSITQKTNDIKFSGYITLTNWDDILEAGGVDPSTIDLDNSSRGEITGSVTYSDDKKSITRVNISATFFSGYDYDDEDIPTTTPSFNIGFTMNPPSNNKMTHEMVVFYGSNLTAMNGVVTLSK